MHSSVSSMISRVASAGRTSLCRNSRMVAAPAHACRRAIGTSRRVVAATPVAPRARPRVFARLASAAGVASAALIAGAVVTLVAQPVNAEGSADTGATATAEGARVTAAMAPSAKAGRSPTVLPPAGDSTDYWQVDMEAVRERRHKRSPDDAHLIYDTLWGPGMVEDYRIWMSKHSNSMVCGIRIGTAGVGHTMVVHGGATAALADNLFGALHYLRALREGTPAVPVVTANLTVNYRSPWLAEEDAVFVAEVERAEGRKIFMKGRFENAKTGKTIAQTTALFITLRAPIKLAPAQTAK